ncbi:MAG: hypothetical protein R3E96_00880 [Planctomycetota bacterium]
MKVLSAQASAAWRFAALALCLLLASSFAPQPAPAPVPNVELMVYDFDLGPEPVSNVERMRLLGFTGLVTRCSVPSDLPKLAAYVRRAGPHWIPDARLHQVRLRHPGHLRDLAGRGCHCLP